MKTYNELTTEQKKAAFNYHLNTLIPPLDLLETSPVSEPWSTLDKQVAALTPQAQANAEAATYNGKTGLPLNLALATC